jgi:hypothetical protein
MVTEASTIAPETFAERERVITVLREHEAALRALGVANLWLFGALAGATPGQVATST